MKGSLPAQGGGAHWPLAGGGRSGQEFQRVWAAYRRGSATAAPQSTLAKAGRPVTATRDGDLRPSVIKGCAYFPYLAKICVNGDEYGT